MVNLPNDKWNFQAKPSIFDKIDFVIFLQFKIDNINEILIFSIDTYNSKIVNIYIKTFRAINFTFFIISIKNVPMLKCIGQKALKYNLTFLINCIF